MQIGQILVPRKLDMDSSPLNIQSDTSFFMKGVEIDWINGGDGVANAGEIKPMESNQLYCSVTLPDGINQCIGFHFYEEATEGYVVVHNSNNNHLIYRLEGLTGQCRIVYRFCPPAVVPIIPATPIINILSGGNILEGINTGNISGTPGSTVLITIATTVGSLLGSIGTEAVSNGTGTNDYEITIPPSGQIDYSLTLANVPQPQIPVYIIANGSNSVIVTTSFGQSYNELATLFAVGNVVNIQGGNFGGANLGIFHITGQTTYQAQIGVILTFQEPVPLFGPTGSFYASLVPVPSALMSVTLREIRVVEEFATNITNNPKDFFSEGRITIKSLCKFLPDGSKQLYKEILLVNKKIPNARIVVEDSIATNSFTTPFFTPKNSCCGDCNRIIKVGVPTPMADIKVVPIPVSADDKTQNEMFYKMFKFRFKHINGWGQESEHGKISNPYFNSLSSCAKDTSGGTHCVWLETKTPCPEIVKIVVEVQSCALKGDTGTTDSSLLSDWKEYVTIDLYDQTDPDLKWYDRTYKLANKEFEFFNDGKDIRIKFCNNRECKSIAIADIRNQNPAPIKSGTVAAIGKGLVYGDNENNYDKILEKDKSGISFEVIPTIDCEIKYSRIKVYAVVHNRNNNRAGGRGINEPVWTAVNGKIGFGGYLVPNGDPNNIFGVVSTTGSSGWGQYFPPGVKGFRAILAGTGYTAESKQKYWTPTSLTDFELVAGSIDIATFVLALRFGQKLLIQEFDFGMVPQGEYLFRIMGHSDTENLESTSTYYICTQSWNIYKQSGALIFGDNRKEIYINTTTGDYDGLANDTIAVILDLSNNDTGVPFKYGVTFGYLYEDTINKQPIELAKIQGGDSRLYHTTDHNGFYFMSAICPYNVSLYGYNRCSPNVLLGNSLPQINVGARVNNIYATNLWTNYVTDLCNRYVITGKIKECGLGTGIAGITVVMGRSKPVSTNNNGEFRIVGHFNDSRGTDIVTFSTGGGCNIVDCNCEPVHVSLSVVQPLCALPGCFLTVKDIGFFNLRLLQRFGFEHGSRVPFGVQATDWLGRHTDIQDMESWTKDIPTEQEQGNSSYPRVKVNLPISFSPEFTKYFKFLTFFFAKNVSYEDFFEWSADKIEFIDSAGVVNSTNPSKVKIWYRGLNEYNLVRGFKTNTTWKILDTAGDSRAGDVVEFIQNADGKYLPVGLTASVQYDKGGTYFLVDYDSSLLALKDGVRFKLKRPYLCETPRPYYEHSFTINFCNKDGIPRDDDGNVVSSFFLNGFTAYMLPRQIPVITDVTSSTGEISQNKKIKIYPFNFEHHSPSDTWGDHCFSGGRVGFKNPYEGKKCDRNQLLLTGALNNANDGAINYLHYFSLEDELLIDEQGWGGIQAIIVANDGQIMLICETTTFSLAYNDDRARVTADGYVKLPINNKFSKPEKDYGFAFGCQTKDLNTIRRNGPIVMWLDSQKCAVVIHNFATAVDVSAGIKTWLTEGIKLSNSNDDIYFHANFDNRGDKKYILTRFNKKLNQFVNDEFEQNKNLNETVAFNFIRKAWEQLLHYTPEYFGNMYGEAKDTQFFSFKNGQAYSHHNAITPATKYLNYFGIQCTPVIGVVTNTEGTKVKSYLFNDVYCFDQLFIIEKILTEMGQKSSLLEGMWEWSEGFWHAPYLCDTEYVDQSDPEQGSAIIDGDTLYGRWMKATYIAYNKNGTPYDGRFFKLTAIISFVFPREKSSK